MTNQKLSYGRWINTKHCGLFIFFAVLLVFACFSLPVAMATIDADACLSGDHDWILASTDYSGYGGHDYFNVESCADVPYSHNHYYVTGQLKLRYECFNCEATMTETKTYRDHELGDQCTVHNTGR